MGESPPFLANISLIQERRRILNTASLFGFLIRLHQTGRKCQRVGTKKVALADGTVTREAKYNSILYTTKNEGSAEQDRSSGEQERQKESKKFVLIMRKRKIIPYPRTNSLKGRLQKLV